MYRCFMCCHGDQSFAEFFVSPYLIRLSHEALIIESFCCVSPLCLWPLTAAGAEDLGQSKGHNHSLPLKSGALAADQLVL